jgi:membrane associated rhomboid family serine protease
MFPFHDDNPTERTPILTFGLIGLNVVVFLWFWLLPPERQEIVTFQRGFVPARVGALREHRPLVVTLSPREVGHGFNRQVVQPQIQLDPVASQVALSLLTCMFLHGGWLHLLGNMWFLWIFGDNVEDRLGPLLYLGLYLFGGLAASAAHWASMPTSGVPVIGASGAVAAVLGAYAIAWPHARVKTLVILVVFITIIDLPALLVLGIWFLGQILSAMGDANPGVAWWAHVGGFLTGAGLMAVLGGLPGPARPDVPADDSRGDEPFPPW